MGEKSGVLGVDMDVSPIEVDKFPVPAIACGFNGGKESHVEVT
jgi:hypothetical protein